jgi:hypothetical protein
MVRLAHAISILDSASISAIEQDWFSEATHASNDACVAYIAELVPAGGKRRRKGGEHCDDMGFFSWHGPPGKSVPTGAAVVAFAVRTASSNCHSATATPSSLRVKVCPLCASVPRRLQGRAHLAPMAPEAHACAGYRGSRRALSAAWSCSERRYAPGVVPVHRRKARAKFGTVE